MIRGPEVSSSISPTIIDELPFFLEPLLWPADFIDWRPTIDMRFCNTVDFLSGLRSWSTSSALSLNVKAAFSSMSWCAKFWKIYSRDVWLTAYS